MPSPLLLSLCGHLPCCHLLLSLCGQDLDLPLPPHSTERKRKEAIAREKERLQTLDEEEYDALTPEEKIAFDREVRQALRERKKRWEPMAGHNWLPLYDPQSGQLESVSTAPQCPSLGTAQELDSSPCHVALQKAGPASSGCPPHKQPSCRQTSWSWALWSGVSNIRGCRAMLLSYDIRPFFPLTDSERD